MGNKNNKGPIRTFYFYRLYELDDNKKRHYHIQAIEKYLNTIYKSTNVKLTQMSQSIFAGITTIRKNNDFYAFNIEKADNTKKAIVVDTNKNISDGREEYGGAHQNEGAARDTIVGYNSHNGLLILTGKPAMGAKMVKNFFEKSISGLKSIHIEYVIDESKKIENVAKLDSIDRVEFRVSRIKNDEAETMKDFVSLGNHKLECKLYGGGIVVPKIKQMFKNLKRYVTGTNSEISKFKVIGADDGDTQVIDLISRRVTDEARIGLEDGKVTIEAMMEAVTKIYEENKKELKFIRIQC